MCPLPIFRKIMAKIIGVPYKTNPSKYLGVDVDDEKSKKENFNELVEKIDSKLKGWKSMFLSPSWKDNTH